MAGHSRSRFENIGPECFCRDMAECKFCRCFDGTPEIELSCQVDPHKCDPKFDKINSRVRMQGLICLARDEPMDLGI